MSIKLKIQQIAEDLNNTSIKDDYLFGRLQDIRKRKGHSASKKPFSKKGMKEFYAFHNGGLHEFQFNFGRETIGNKKYFRYGLALNLRRGQSLHYPLEVFKEKINRYNKFYRKNKNYFNGLSMWYFDKDGMRHSIKKPALLDKSLAKEGNFIVWGKLIRKPTMKINHSDVIKILELYDKLMELYEYTEFGEIFSKVETRIARICWNTNGWIKPTGWEGKAKGESMEKYYGFGNEEWLFDMAKNYKGYHYGFLQPINRYHKKYIGHRYNLILYTIDNNTKQKYWVGKLDGVEIIDMKEAKEVHSHYVKKGWIKEYQMDLNKLDLWDSDVKEFWYKPNSHFNIRFKPQAVKGLFDDLAPFKNSKLFKKPRYMLNYLPAQTLLSELSDDGFDPDSGSSMPGGGKKKKSKRVVNAEIEISQKHSDILNGFMKYLKKNYRGQKIKKESKAFGNTRIDLYRRDGKKYIFYEIKSYNKLKTSLRVAIGQLLEYCCYPDKRNAKKLILVSDLEPDINFNTYIKSLRNIVDIPIGYIQFDTETKKVVTEI